MRKSYTLRRQSDVINYDKQINLTSCNCGEISEISTISQTV